MTRFTKTKKALRALTDTILGGSSNVVRTLKVAGHMNENSCHACLRGVCQSYPVLLPSSFFAEEASLHQRPGNADNGLS